MNKYETGNYVMLLFDHYGTKKETRLLGNSGLIVAQKEGQEAIDRGECDSFIVYRVLYNSKD